MAEFCEVMRQAKRMCKMYESRCERCPFGQSDGCPFNFFKRYNTTFDFSGVERIVMNWAAKNPEPRYPSWNEWWKREFPAADNAISPCTFGIRERFACFGQGCDACRAKPIPADIAEKLGIKPIGGEEDA